MNNKRFFHAIWIVVIALIFGLLIAPAREGLGDFGGFSGRSDYDRGGSSGGSSRSSGGGWSGGSSLSNGSDWSSGSAITLGSAVGTAALSGMLGDDDDDLGGFEEIIVGLFVLFILYQAFKSTKGSKKGRGVNIPPLTPRPNLKPMAQYQKLDPNFDEAQFRAWIAKVYVQLQEAWQAKELEPIRPYLTNSLYNQMNGSLDLLRKKRYTNYVENIAVLGVDFQGFTQKGGLDCIVARVTTRITDYTLDDTTGKLVSGDRKREKFMEYDWELVRKTGVITSKLKDSEIKAATCPHCGAPIDKNASMKCAYCGSILTATSEEWTITNMQGISQRTK